jgi:hypothetical protein
LTSGEGCGNRDPQYLEELHASLNAERDLVLAFGRTDRVVNAVALGRGRAFSLSSCTMYRPARPR